MADGSAIHGEDGKFLPGNPGGPGRNSTYTEKIAEAICEGLKSGMTLRAVCRQIGISEVTVRSWAGQIDHPFYAQYARAREIGYHAMADEIVEISDDGSNDWMEREGRDVENGEAIARSRLRVDTRKWLLSKALPKIYGERVENRVTGPDGGAVQVNDNSTDARAIAFMLGRAVGRQETATRETSQKE